MPRFNIAPTPPKPDTVNLAGGQAYSQTPEHALVNFLLTNMLKDQFYRSADAATTTLVSLIQANDPLFAAKAAVFARNVFGMRSVSHVVAGELAASKFEGKRAFYSAVVRRPDDMGEILGYVFSKASDRSAQKVPNAMKRGFASAFNKFDNYQIAKYQMGGRNIGLVDIVNLVHPVPTDRNAMALTALIKGNLTNANLTWESALSAAGNDSAKKAQAWYTLLADNRVGHMALLKNLRNILDLDDSSLAALTASRLTNEGTIRRSLVFPYRYVIAYNELRDHRNARWIVEALNTAAEISLNNVPTLPGKTAVVVDTSGSMFPIYNSNKVSDSPIFTAAAFALALYRRNDTDLIHFNDRAEYLPLLPSIPVLAGVDVFLGVKPGGTNFHAIWDTLKRPYDRVIILSDMQAWSGGYHTADTELRNYQLRHHTNPQIFNIDLTGYGTMQQHGSKVWSLAGISDKVFDIMNTLESPQGMIKQIWATPFITSPILSEAESE